MNQKEMRSLRTPSRSHEDRAALEARRLEAGRLFEKGYTQAAVRRKVGGDRSAVYQWHTKWKQGGMDALRSTGTSGPTPKLSEENKRTLADDIRAGAREHGFPTEVWTLPRIIQHVRSQFGVVLGESRVAEILHEIGFSKQKPERRSRERDGERIETWKRTTLPALKKRAQ